MDWFWRVVPLLAALGFGVAIYGLIWTIKRMIVEAIREASQPDPRPETETRTPLGCAGY